MKVTWIVPHFPPHIGGGEQLYLAVCKGLVERGIEVRVITSSSGGVTGHRNVEGVEVDYCDWKLLFGHPLVKTSDIRGAVGWCDIVHTTIYSTAIPSFREAKRTGKPCVLTLHEVMDEKWAWFTKNPVKALMFRIYERMILKKPFFVQAVSEATKRDYLNFKAAPRKEEVRRIYNFLDLPPVEEVSGEEIDYRGYFSLNENEKSILYFGRPAANKGIFVLLDAIRIYSERIRKEGGEQISRVVPGTSDPKPLRFCLLLSENPADQHRETLRRIEEYGIGDMITIRPSLPRKKMLKVLSGAECCVIPSVTEGFGYSAAEACEYDRPVIASDGGSLPEVVSGKCLFFRNKDAKDLADRLLLYAKEGTEAFTAIPKKHFDREKAVDEYLSMYRDVLGVFPDQGAKE